MNAQSILKEYITTETLRGRDSQLNATDDLLATGLLDSLGILQLVAFLEDRFKIRVADEDVVYENFHSIAAISRYLDTVQQKVSG